MTVSVGWRTFCGGEAVREQHERQFRDLQEACGESDAGTARPKKRAQDET